MQLTAAVDWVRKAQNEETAKRRSLAGACLAHFLHDGYTDQLYALLPIWQPEFGLSYAKLAIFRALYSGTMGLLQIPVEKCTGGLSSRHSLALATFIAAAGYLLMSLPLGFSGLCVGLIIAGVGSSFQHPRASLLVTNAFGENSRGALGIYNFAGDLGKTAFPAVVAMLLPFLAWRPVVGITSLAGFATAVALLYVLPQRSIEIAPAEPKVGEGRDERGFGLLFTIGALDTATRMGFMLFLPFLITAKGGGEATIGVALALLFAGGAFGKACCGWLGHRLGVVWCVIATEAGTALLMLAVLAAPLRTALFVLPLLGVVLNGTSSVLYGTVPELSRRGEVGRAFALFYTGVIGAGGLAPIAYGALADHSSRLIAVVAAAGTALAIIPLVLALRPCLRDARRPAIGTA